MEGPSWKPRFFAIWAGQAFSLVGSRLVQFALIWWLTESTGSATTLALASVAGLLPTIVLGPFAGALVDRWNRRRVLILSDGSTALFTLLLAALFWLGVARPWHIYLILFLRSLGDAFQTPAMMSTTALLVPREQLARVGGMNSTLDGVIRFVAPPLGALLLGLLKVQGVLPIDVATAAIAIVPLLLFASPGPAATASASRGVRSVLQGLGEGVRYVWHSPGVLLLSLTAAFVGLLAQPLIAFLPLLVTKHFGGQAQQLAWLQSAFGIGLVSGGLLLGAWGGFKRHMATSIAGTFGCALGILVIALAPSAGIWVAALGYAVWGIAFAPHGAGLNATLQAAVPPEKLGRVYAINQSLCTLTGPVALAIAGPLADRIGVRPFYFVAAAGALAVAIVRRLTPAIYLIEDEAPGALPATPSVPPGTAAAR